MTNLPGPETLARLVSGVTETMFGLSFSLFVEGCAEAPPWQRPTWRTVLLEIDGGRPHTVAIASDQASAATLGGAMFSCAAAEVDDSMAADSLGELVNIVAGQVKRAISLDAALGLPRMVVGGGDDAMNRCTWRGATLRGASSELKVWVAIADTPPSENTIASLPGGRTA